MGDFRSTDPLTWAEAKADAESRIHQGMTGYLATVTSEAENDFLLGIHESNAAFLGGSDADEEGVWKWVTGPEAGQVFQIGNYPDPTRQSLMYTDWGGNEPNDFASGEDFMTLDTRAGGEWNDVPGEPFTAAYFVEYGGFLQGDVNGDGLLTVEDLDQLTDAIRQNMSDPVFDVNDDGRVDSFDRLLWVTDLKRTVFGDANLDGEFNSTDLLQLFQAGEYEDGVPGNSTWGEGDFGGDFEFDSDDLVLALQTGAYEQGPVAASPVPEPDSILLVLVGLVAIARYRNF